MSESKTQWYLYEREEKGESRIEKLEQENKRLREAIQSLGLRLVETIDGVWGITSDNARISLQKNNLSELEIDKIINEWNR